MSDNRKIRNRVPVVFSILPLVATFFLSEKSHGQANYANDWSGLLNVIVFAERSHLGGDDVTFDLLEQPSAKFPVEFSRILQAGLTRSSDELTRLGLPPALILDDLYTFELTEKVLQDPELIRRNNPFSELEYSLKIENWSKESYDITLRGRVRKNGFKGVTAHAQGDRTTILRINDDDRLYFAFTPLGAVDFARGMAKFGDKDLKLPVPVRQTVPPLPKELINRKVTGESTSYLVFIGIVEISGLMNPSDYLLVECPHEAFARDPLRKIFQEWKLRPAEKGGKPVASAVPVELQFNLN